MDEAGRIAVLRRHWDYAATDQEITHEIYHDDAILAELHFQSMEALQTAVASPSAQQVVAHAVSISSGGMPVVLVAEEETRTF